MRVSCIFSPKPINFYVFPIHLPTEIWAPSPPISGRGKAFLWTTPTERLKVLRQNDIKSGLKLALWVVKPTSTW